MLVVLVVLAAGLGSTAAQALQNPYLTGNRTTCPYRYNGHAFVVCSGQGEPWPRTVPFARVLTACSGRCVPPGECVCAVGFRGNDCSYALRSRRTAFTLSFLLGNWGAGRLYMGLIGTGVLKLMLMVGSAQCHVTHALLTHAQMLLMAMPCFPMCCMCVTYEQRKLRLLYRVVVGAR